MNTQHTPGPWTISGMSTINTLGGNKTYIASIAKNDRHANARLIAAAPDLLATLEKVDAYLAPDKNDDDEWHEIRAIIQTAIAKAKGE